MEPYVGIWLKIFHGMADGSKLTDEQAYTIKMNAITEWAALPNRNVFA